MNKGNNQEEEKQIVEMSDFDSREKIDIDCSLLRTFNRSTELKNIEDIPLSKNFLSFLISSRVLSYNTPCKTHKIRF